MIYKELIARLKQHKLFAILIDPEETTPADIEKLVPFLDPKVVDYILVGGSLVSQPTDALIERIHQLVSIPVILFPGSVYQLSGKADALLLLSLISGRNPEFLIGHHVVAAPIIRTLGLETIPTGYIIIGDGKTSAVEYMSNTLPIPPDKTALILATALAGEYLGQQLIYLERGSGASEPIDAEIIAKVKQELTIPLVVGGGIRTVEQARDLYHAGADMLVAGTRIEQDPGFIRQLGKIKR